ncbi:Paternally-expressed 3 protein [Eufriesea mexicana]|uniref:Paternally-expressed 3 protein n=1 Tax=Eufriesea mexicana TaxID=516756 RepID=A0A310S984_9HYME|nr:Paternally-expressed 3 protein [Eufriesea mexicana]
MAENNIGAALIGANRGHAAPRRKHRCAEKGTAARKVKGTRRRLAREERWRADLRLASRKGDFQPTPSTFAFSSRATLEYVRDREGTRRRHVCSLDEQGRGAHEVQSAPDADKKEYPREASPSVLFQASFIPPLPGFLDPIKRIHQLEEQIANKINDITQHTRSLLDRSTQEAYSEVNHVKRIGTKIKTEARHKIKSILSEVGAKIDILKEQTNCNNVDHCIEIVEELHKAADDINGQVNACVTYNGNKAVHIMQQINHNYKHLLHTLDDASRRAARCTASTEFFPEIVECLNTVMARTIKLSIEERSKITKDTLKLISHINEIKRSTSGCTRTDIIPKLKERARKIIEKVKECISGITDTEEPASSSTEPAVTTTTGLPASSSTEPVATTSTELSTSSSTEPAATTVISATTTPTELPISSTEQAATTSTERPVSISTEPTGTTGTEEPAPSSTEPADGAGTKEPASSSTEAAVTTTTELPASSSTEQTATTSTELSTSSKPAIVTTTSSEDELARLIPDCVRELHLKLKPGMALSAVEALLQFVEGSNYGMILSGTLKRMSQVASYNTKPLESAVERNKASPTVLFQASFIPPLPGFIDPIKRIHQLEEQIANKIVDITQHTRGLLDRSTQEANSEVNHLKRIGTKIKTEARHKIKSILSEASFIPPLPGFIDPIKRIHQLEEQIANKIVDITQHTRGLLDRSTQEANSEVNHLKRIGTKIKTEARHKIKSILSEVGAKIDILKEQTNCNNVDHCIEIVEELHKAADDINGQVNACVTYNGNKAVHIMQQINHNYKHLLRTLDDAGRQAARCTASTEFFPEVVECLNTKLHIKLRPGLVVSSIEALQECIESSSYGNISPGTLKTMSQIAPYNTQSWKMLLSKIMSNGS